MPTRVRHAAISDITVAPDRQLITSASALGILREQLVRNLGLERTRGVLFKAGWEMGAHDAREAMGQDLPLRELFNRGPMLHIRNGQITGIKLQCSIELDDDRRVKAVTGGGVWESSYEASEHLARLGKSTGTVCHTLVGYGSGFMSTITGEDIFFKEETCVGKGDAECSWSVRRKRDWDAQSYPGMAAYEAVPLVEEFEYTYVQLLEKTDFLTRLAEFQSQITQEVIAGASLSAITELTASLLGVAVAVEQLDFEPLTLAGIDPARYLELKSDIELHLLEAQEENGPQVEQLHVPRTVATQHQQRLIAPIFLHKDILGYCSFLYEGGAGQAYEQDFLFLDRFASAASLVLLNEKTKFESFERMKGNFLEQILHGQLQDAEIFQRGMYIGLDLRKPYHIGIVKYTSSEMALAEEYYLQTSLFETVSTFFDQEGRHALISQRDRDIVIYLPDHAGDGGQGYQPFERFASRLTEKFPDLQFRFGMSNRGSDIREVPKRYQEAIIALRLAAPSTISHFGLLGILGVLVNSNNMDAIKIIAKQELGPLLDEQDEKARELIITLYVFLRNGGKLEQTMSDLALSINGLRYRIKKIETVLGKDLRDPQEMHQLFLLITSLVAIGDLAIPS